MKFTIEKGGQLVQKPDPKNPEELIDVDERWEMPWLQRLECGHENNLKLKGRISGVCPKGCK